MKYVMKPRQVEAVPYTEGLEDGLQCEHYGKMICKEGDKDLSMTDYPRCRKCKSTGNYCNRPFKKTAEGRQILLPNHMIITDHNGRVFLLTKQAFDLLYEPAESPAPKCNHLDSDGDMTIAYDSPVEMRSSDMHCTKCGKSGTRDELVADSQSEKLGGVR